jgi:hypothetical protein
MSWDGVAANQSFPILKVDGSIPPFEAPLLSTKISSACEVRLPASRS